LDIDESIFEISGKASSVLDHITIKTNKGKELSVGGSGGNSVNNLIPFTGKMNQIVGIGGASGTCIHNFYCYYI